MKTLALSIVFASLPAFSAPKKEIIQGQATVRVRNVLRCVIEPGRNATFENSAYTELNSKESRLRIRNEQGAIELNLDHPNLTVSGCDLENLNKIIDASVMQFGFAQGAPAVVTRETEKSFINGFNQCVALTHETVEINITKAYQEFGENADLRDLVLTSKDSQLIQADDCSKE